MFIIEFESFINIIAPNPPAAPNSVLILPLFTVNVNLCTLQFSNCFTLHAIAPNNPPAVSALVVISILSTLILSKYVSPDVAPINPATDLVDPCANSDVLATLVSITLQSFAFMLFCTNDTPPDDILPFPKILQFLTLQFAISKLLAHPTKPDAVLFVLLTA